MDRHTLILRLYIALVLAVFGLDSFAESVGSPYVQSTTLSVTKIPWLFEDGLGWVPGTRAISWAHGGATFFAWCALSVQFGTRGVRRRRWATAFAAACYTFAYMATALNRYQHKYFLIILLWSLALPEAYVRKYVKTSIAILYFWTAVAKVADGGTFLSGYYLPYLLATSRIDYLFTSILGSSFGPWAILPYVTVVTELVISALFVTGKWPVVAAVLIVLLHGAFQLTGSFKIGLFSYYMMVQCLLLV